ncbi:hypothetical protein TD95_004102 [Thielaviopsis punctulata]|uniref:BHLH domain-containing protein n=1 Tax=Thielaviopsis punctulata TaxID=72032 RepID=A0A0F4Z9Q9_9PEZI|nr:hypothetical protein TD95_004102 [Thielaviopsis punctulata]
MPRASPPHTPVSPKDRAGKNNTPSQASSLQLAFELPPPALTNTCPASTTATSKPRKSDASADQYPIQAAEAVKSRRRASTLKDAQNDGFALPPPPTRTRKIIQMKPRAAQGIEKAEKTAATRNAAACHRAAAGEATDELELEAPAEGAGKKRQASVSTQAGRKQARKTAHSLIERRRRSKMNEEFSVLKNMIPACSGEMHKLAILQASIEYIRYLEDCIDKLKTEFEVTKSTQETQLSAGLEIDAFNLPPEDPISHAHSPTDVDMGDSDASPSPTTLTAAPAPSHSLSHSHHSSVSPALLPHTARARHDSYSSVSTDHQRYAYTSATTSPAFGPQQYTGYAALPGSALTMIGGGWRVGGVETKVR